MNTTASPSKFAQQLPRIATGLILAAALVACLVLGGYYLAGALALVSALALFEFFQMFWPGKTKLCSKIFGIVAGTAVFCPSSSTALLHLLAIAVLVWSAMSFLMDYGRGNDEARFEKHAIVPLGLLYVPFILHMALGLTLKEQFLVVVAAIASDTAAYYAGSAFGRHKIWPRVSPKKSWQGSIAGFVATIAATIAIACIPYGDGPLLGGNIFLWAGVGALLNIASQFGDFFESALKRACDVKDSSALLPGHGGVLDRIDSILFSLAAYGAAKFTIVSLFV